MKKIIISIDGPAASGKGKIAKYISKKWKYKHLDSGTLYRRLAFILIKNEVNTVIDHESTPPFASCSTIKENSNGGRKNSRKVCALNMNNAPSISKIAIIG